MDTLTTKLRDSGLRITAQRRAIFTALSHEPQSVLAILQTLRSTGLEVDQATIYRALDTFVELGLAAKTQLGGAETLYERADEHAHHHHIVCRSCGTIADVQLSEEVLMQTVQTQTNFEVTGHAVEFFGVCKLCQ